MKALRDMPKYLVASAFSFVFIIGATAALHELLGVSEATSPAIAMAAALVVNFIILRVWVFPGQTVHWGRQFAETVVTSAAFRLLEYGIFLVLHLALDMNYLVATGASVCVSALGKFGFYREVVFRPDRAGAEVAAVADSRPEPDGSTADGTRAPTADGTRAPAAADPAPPADRDGVGSA